MYALLVEHLVGDGELDGLEVRVDEGEPKELDEIEHSEFELREVFHQREEQGPIDDYGGIKGSLKVNIVPLEYFPFFLCWVSLIKAEKLIKQRYESIANK